MANLDPMELVMFVPNLVMQGATNFYRNATGMFDDMTLIRYIRMIAVLGAYLFLRPYLEKLGAKLMKKGHEESESDPYSEAIAGEGSKGKSKKITPNSLRDAGGKKVEIEDSGSEEEPDTSSANWGKKARKRQRTMVKKVLEEQERKLKEDQEDDEDKDIRDLLVDYEEGVDGW